MASEETVSVRCEINGDDVEITGAATRPVAEALRERGLFGVRETCGVGICGTCTVRLDGAPVSSCILPLLAVDGRVIETVEGLETEGRLSPLQRQFIESQAFQCSFCTPGFLMSCQALLDRTEGELTPQEVAEALHGHICRCGCYASVVEAVVEVSRQGRDVAEPA